MVQTPSVQTKKSSHLTIRMQPDEKRIIRHVANMQNKTMSGFVRDSALKEAQEVLWNQVHFTLSPEKWDAFTAVLDAPVQPNRRLQHLLARKPVWAP